MGELRFRSRIEIVGINPYAAVEAAMAQMLAPGWRRPLPVLVRVGEGPEVWRTNLTPVGDGRFRLYLHGGMRKAAGVNVGDEVEIALSFDVDYRGGPVHPMPAALADGLERCAAARAAWVALRPSEQKEVLRYLAALKSDVTLNRNIGRALHVLSGGEGRFLGRSWNSPEDAGDHGPEREGEGRT